MTRVMAAGVFDLVHLGHVRYLEEARGHGDELVVVVATDKSVRERKRPPILPEEMRVELVRALKPVDEAVLGREDDHFETVRQVDPDVIALGYDDHHREADLAADLEARDLGHIEVVRCKRFEHDVASTRRIVERIRHLEDKSPPPEGVEPS